MKNEKYFTKSVYCAFCGSDTDKLYHLGDLDNIKEQKQITLHCCNKDCRATFIILKKKRQESFFKKIHFCKGKLIY